VQLLIIALMFFVGAAVFHHFRADWLTALLGSVSTVTTIGLYSRISSRWPTRKKSVDYHHCRQRRFSGIITAT